MLNVARTIEVFGYDPASLARWSKNKVIGNCDICKVEVQRRYDQNFPEFRYYCNLCYPKYSSFKNNLRLYHPNLKEICEAYANTWEPLHKIANRFGISVGLVSDIASDNKLLKRTKKTRVTDDEIIQLYKSGKSITQIYKQLHIHQTRARKIILDYQKANSLKAGRYFISKEKLEEEYLTNNLSTNEIGSKYGVSSSYVNAWLKCFKIKIRSRHDPIYAGKGMQKWNECIPSSRAQRYICSLFNGTLNAKIGRRYVDVLLDDKIVLEYDGSGHFLRDKLIKDEATVKANDAAREIELFSAGCKIIRISSTRDKLPAASVLFNMLAFAKHKFLVNNSIYFNIDAHTVISGGVMEDYDFGKLLSQHELTKIYKAAGVY